MSFEKIHGESAIKNFYPWMIASHSAPKNYSNGRCIFLGNSTPETHCLMCKNINSSGSLDNCLLNSDFIHLDNPETRETKETIWIL